MATTVFTPKEVATALGVSESSVKRWVDSGRLPAARTAGGHRKVALPEIAAFVRQTGHDLQRPDVLGMVAVNRRTPIERAADKLYDALSTGDLAACRDIVLGFYQRGESVVDIGDRLVGPAMRRIGDGWEAGDVRVYEERRACKTAEAALSELRRWLPSPGADAPLAVAATPLRDFAEVAVRTVELALVAAGWRVVPAGSGLPLEEIRDAVVGCGPRLVCVSVTHLETGVEAFAEAYNRELVEPTVAAASGPISHAIGGGALATADREAFACDLFGQTLADLVSFAETLDSAPE